MLQKSKYHKWEIRVKYSNFPFAFGYALLLGAYPISKKAIRKVLKENLDIARTGKKILVERQQFLDFLRHEI